VILAERLKKVKFMYRVAATTYGTLCERTSSFAPFEWNVDIQKKYLGPGGSASNLEEAVKELRASYTKFCKGNSLHYYYLLIVE
jgi:hypothetical protein